MHKRLLTHLFTWLLVIGLGTHSYAQTPAAPGGGYTAWFELRNNVLVLHSEGKNKPVSKSVTLLNGTRLDYQTRTATLADGKSVALREGDQVSLDGTITPAAGAATAAAKPAAPAPAPQPTEAVASVAPAPAPAPAVAPEPAKPAPARFAYQPVAPRNGKLKGVVELGSSGFNSFVVRVDADKNWKLERSEFGNSLVLENMATEDDVRRGLKSYIGQMLDYGVRGQDIHFVVSSGALMADVTKRIVQSLKALGYVATTVTPEQEGVYGLHAVLPSSYTGRAFVVDLGSGNTKISWLQGLRPVSEDTYGAKYYQKNTPDAAVAAGVREQASKVPASQRGTCFIIGGVPYELAKAARQGQERYTVLRAATEYPQLTGAKNLAGLNIYQALQQATGCQEFVFDWDANFTIGYLLSIP
ncbi:DUF6799 domain-containing protein [Hymenobacter latericus]|uniref:DUF6799 domain-containing protein n=1 Tax=Hymenobacter sp. YIM 151858-1 TaxID=2987688 RepID=UPI00222608B8|nr:DUF6799 domain-containing protein [Hymenobacter sp. YIM 151858-1]UYZ59881.1 hypothetical protein OIS50_03575 [Hymenobacter sp. YIM 151858-1]